MGAASALRQQPVTPSTARSAEIRPFQPAPPPAAVKPWRNPSDMPVAVHKLALACWAAFLSVFWITFAFSGHASFMVAVSTVYAVVFFAVPIILTRICPPDERQHDTLSSFLQGRFETIDGSIAGFDALVQVIVVPATLTLGGIAIGFIIHAARLAH